MLRPFGNNLRLGEESARRLNELSTRVADQETLTSEIATASGRSLRYSVFPAVITGSQEITTNRWKYSWVEHVPGVTPPAPANAACRRSDAGGDAFALFALNGAEASNIAKDDYQSYGELVKSDATATVTLLPIGGDPNGGLGLTVREPLVMMMEFPAADDAFDGTRFMFFAANSISVECVE